MGLAYLPIILFVVVLYAGASEIGVKGVLISIGFVAGSIAVSVAMENPAPYLIVTALTDIILCLIVFGGNLTIR